MAENEVNQDHVLFGTRGPKDGVLFTASAARVLIWLGAIASAIAGVIVALQTDASAYDHSNHPNLALGLTGGFLAIVSASFMLAVVEYMTYRVNNS
jgi:hypothetical protein